MIGVIVARVQVYIILTLFDCHCIWRVWPLPSSLYLSPSQYLPSTHTHTHSLTLSYSFSPLLSLTPPSLFFPLLLFMFSLPLIDFQWFPPFNTFFGLSLLLEHFWRVAKQPPVIAWKPRNRRRVFYTSWPLTKCRCLPLMAFLGFHIPHVAPEIKSEATWRLMD